jgi:WD40 repeat protein
MSLRYHGDADNLKEAQRAEALAAFQRALVRETHVLRRNPELLWQQLYNRLQLEDEPIPRIIEPAFERRRGPGAKPWLRTRTRYRESKALVCTLEGHTDWVGACGWSPDGRRLISGSGDNTLKIWDAGTGKEIRTLEAHGGGVLGCAWSPDGDRVVSTSLDNTVKIWYAKTGDEIHTLRGHSSYVPACAWSPDGGRIVTASHDKTLKMWDTETGEGASKAVRALEGHGRPVGACAWSPDGTRIVSASHDKTLKIWNAETGRHMTKAAHTVAGHSRAISACAYRPDGSRVVSASDDETLKIWDSETGHELRTVAAHIHHVYDCAYSPDGNQFVSTSEDHRVKVWDGETGNELRLLRAHTGTVFACAYSPDGGRLVSGAATGGWDEPDQRGGLKIWDVLRGRVIHTLEGHDDAVRGCAFSPGGRRVVSGSEDNTLKLWNAETGKQIHTLAGHGGCVRACAWSPDGRRVVSGSKDKTLKIWDAGTAECIAELPLPGSVTAAVHHPCCRAIACGDSGGSIYFVDILGVALSPIVVTATHLGDGPALRCPVCFERYPLQNAWLGREISCPGRECDARLQVSPFVARRPGVDEWEKPQESPAMGRRIAAQLTCDRADIECRRRESHKPSVESELLEKLAAAHHSIICDELRGKGYRHGETSDHQAKTSPLLKPYAKLSEEQKEHTRAAVRDIPSDLGRIGYGMIPARSNKPPLRLPDPIIKELAEMEHNHWMKAQIAKGWIYASTKDNVRKLHPALLPWREMSEEEMARLFSPAEIAAIGSEELPEELKEKVRELIRAIHQQVLARAGYTIVKLREENKERG